MGFFLDLARIAAILDTLMFRSSTSITHVMMSMAMPGPDAALVVRVNG